MDGVNIIVHHLMWIYIYKLWSMFINIHILLIYILSDIHGRYILLVCMYHHPYGCGIHINETYNRILSTNIQTHKKKKEKKKG